MIGLQLGISGRLTLVSVFLIQITGTSTFDCYTCSYTLTGDPTLHYECANKPWNVTTGLKTQPCATDKYCIAKVVFEKDKKTIRSVDRGCRDSEMMQCGVNCCDENFYNVVCQYQCQGQNNNGGICNDRDVSKINFGGPTDGTDKKICSYTFIAVILLCAKSLTF